MTHSEPDSLTHLYHEETSNAQSALRAVVRDSGAFARLWRHVTGGHRGPLPTVDFARYMVIAVAMGAQGSTGHQITIAGIETKAGVLHVRVQLTAPGENCLGGGMITRPADLVQVPRSSLLVTFVETLAETRC